MRTPLSGGARGLKGVPAAASSANVLSVTTCCNGTCITLALTSPCQATANLDLRYGVTDRLTAQAGVDRFWHDTLPDRWHPYASITGQPTSALALTAEVVANALIKGRIDLAPAPDFQAVIAHTRFETNVPGSLVGSTFERHRTEGVLFYRPGLMHGQLFLRLTAFHSAGDTRNRDLVRLTATTRLLGTRIDAGVRYDAFRTPPLPRVAALRIETRFFHVYTGPYRALRRTLFIGELHTDLDSGLTRARFAVSRPFGTTLQIDVGADWQRGAGMTLELGVTTTLQAVRAVSRNRYNLDEGVRGTQIAEGSLLWDRVAGRIEFGDGRSLGRAGLTGIVFADANGNGTIDPGEFPIPDVRLQIGPRVVTTDSSGRFAVWDLIPFELVIVEVDTLSIRDPMWLPLTTRFTFRPHPNVFVPLPLPFVQSGEVTGRVVLGPAGSRIAGAGVNIRNLATGDVYTTTTFSDGTFYVLGIRPGEYEATVDAADLAAIGATATPARFTVGRTPDTLIIEGIEVRLVRGGG